VYGGIDWVGPLYQRWSSGELFSLDLSDWTERWGMYPDLAGFIDVPPVSGDYSLFFDLDGDGHDEAVTWGKYFYQPMYDSDESQSTYYLVRVFSLDGQSLGERGVIRKPG
jgi:hypothetical protein